MLNLLLVTTLNVKFHWYNFDFLESKFKKIISTVTLSYLLLAQQMLLLIPTIHFNIDNWDCYLFFKK